MGHHDPLIPCPHCGHMMRAGCLKRHEPLCIKNPTAAARYRAALSSAEDSRRGITCGRYVELSEADKTLPQVITLRRLAGAKTWDKVLAVFGLLPPAAEARSTHCPHCGKFCAPGDLQQHKATCAKAQPKPAPAPKPPRKQIEYSSPRATKPLATCPQCNRQGIDPRYHVCPETPAVVAWLQQNLPDPRYPGCIISYAEYKALPDKAISIEAIFKAYGNWANLAARYGLEKHRPTRKKLDPHLDAASLGELHRLAQELHGGEFGPSHGEYTLYAEPPALRADQLKNRIGTWAVVLAVAGLQHGAIGYYMRAAHARRTVQRVARAAAQQEAQARPGASKYDRGDEPISRQPTGLPVASVRKLPNGGTAWMIR
jgi:hypothetical protein